MKRDLTTDLKSIQEGRTLFDDPDPSVGTKYELYEVAEHAIGRAIKAEKALDNETILNSKALAKLNERADKAETLARELAERLEDALSIIWHRQVKQIAPDWEPTRVYRCREMLDKAKEVIGDEN